MLTYRYCDLEEQIKVTTAIRSFSSSFVSIILQEDVCSTSQQGLDSSCMATLRSEKKSRTALSRLFIHIRSRSDQNSSDLRMSTLSSKHQSSHSFVLSDYAM